MYSVKSLITNSLLYVFYKTALNLILNHSKFIFKRTGHLQAVKRWTNAFQHLWQNRTGAPGLTDAYLVIYSWRFFMILHFFLAKPCFYDAFNICCGLIRLTLNGVKNILSRYAILSAWGTSLFKWPLFSGWMCTFFCRKFVIIVFFYFYTHF